MSEVTLTQAIEIIRALTGNAHINLGDLVYNVREREGLGWEGPSVVGWGAAVKAAEDFLAQVDSVDA